ncbi:hypothetical protein QBC46DRAFT_394374 [Diplogelasinospora grovesii]|uniref:Uncharacterized protein n=1 Tax=Diplogelasinospora grovesii TaxID=303347 RepID=A0AAN6N1X8_9PEZI|nr:hypothetical protein QBC46DRAFT_394374 [Diplogelasinospora grovesii]
MLWSSLSRVATCLDERPTVSVPTAMLQRIGVILDGSRLGVEQIKVALAFIPGHATLQKLVDSLEAYAAALDIVPSQGVIPTKIPSETSYGGTDDSLLGRLDRLISSAQAASKEYSSAVASTVVSSGLSTLKHPLILSEMLPSRPALRPRPLYMSQEVADHSLDDDRHGECHVEEPICSAADDQGKFQAEQPTSSTPRETRYTRMYRYEDDEEFEFFGFC